jgi:HD-GYP domain-containing protein (c-di-GMP phosphodiesterase class II)
MNDDADAHGLRTARLTALLCPLLDVPADEAKLIVRAARIHDIGKQFISESLLAKPEPLTTDERRRIEQHCVLGAWVVMNGNDDAMHAPAIEIAVALSHHEWWNGQGYPFGLAGRAIARPARIVAVADVFDALLTARAYKPAWSPDRALDYMRRGRGVQFDPECVDALLETAPSLPAGWRDVAGSCLPRAGERRPDIVPGCTPPGRGAFA